MSHHYEIHFTLILNLILSIIVQVSFYNKKYLSQYTTIFIWITTRNELNVRFRCLPLQYLYMKYVNMYKNNG